MGMTGLALATLIKQESPQTRVVLMSGNTALEHHPGMQDVDYYLPKPFQLDMLAQIIRSVLR
jgi:DNA-binding response OmpR family regulator